MTPAEFIASIADGASASHKASGVPASITVAQAALESSWGRSALATRANNLFGVKADKAWTGPTITMPTREFLAGKWCVVDARWRRYADVAESIRDHAAFLRNNPRYGPCFKSRTATDFAYCLQRAGYATDPQYASKLIRIMASHGLASLDRA